MKKIKHAIAAAMILLCCQSCGIYSFSGTSIQADIETVTINFCEYKALTVNPTLANNLTEAMKDKFNKLTRLEQVEYDGDLDISWAVTGYSVSTASVTAEETAAMNRLTVNVKVQFTNKKYPADNLENSFSAYADFPSTELLDAVQDSLCEEIVEKLVDDIFTACVAQW